MNKELFKLDKPTENFMVRYTYENLEVGVYPVLFGYRVRGWYTGDMDCKIDWCCGDNHHFVCAFLQIIIEILEYRIGDHKGYVARGIFNGIPTFSEVKPLWNDKNFLERVSLLDKIPRATPIEIGNLGDLKEAFYKKVLSIIGNDN